jgi:hypothetical protein
MKCWVLVEKKEMHEPLVLWQDHKPTEDEIEESWVCCDPKEVYACGPFESPPEQETESEVVDLLKKCLVTASASSVPVPVYEAFKRLSEAVGILDERTAPGPEEDEDDGVEMELPRKRWLNGLSALEAWLREEDAEEATNPGSVVYQFRQMLMDVRDYLYTEISGVEPDIELGEDWTVEGWNNKD